MARFPYRRSVGGDLRDLFGHDRLSGWDRTLGTSSITAGEGGLQLVSGTTTIAIVGDLPGGGFGVGIPNGAGGFYTVQDHVAKKFADLRASDIISNNGTVQADLIWASNKAQAASDRADAAHNRIAGLTASQVASGSGTVQADLTYLGAELVKANNRISNLTASQIATGSGNVAADLTYLGAEAASASSRIGGLTTRMGSAEGSIGTIASNVGSLVSRMAGVESKNSLQDDALAQATARANDMQNKYDALKARIDRYGIPP